MAVVLPVVAPIVDVRKSRSLLESQLVQADPLGFFALGFCVRWPKAALSALKLIEMIVEPPKAELDTPMQLMEAEVLRHGDLAPDRRRDMPKRDTEMQTAPSLDGQAAHLLRGNFPDHRGR